MIALSPTDVTRLDVVLHCRPIGMRRGVTCPCQSKLMMLAIQILLSIIIYMLHCFLPKLENDVVLNVFRFTVLGLL